MTHNVSFPKLGWEMQVNETAFSIGSFEVRWYGVLIAVGFLLAVIYAYCSCKKMNIDMNRLVDAILVGMIGSVVCARLYYVIFYPQSDYYWQNPKEIFNIRNGGLAIYGSVIGALVFGGGMAKIRKLKVAAVFDVTSIGFLIGQCIGRWGNFINQEAFGTATDLPWGMLSENTLFVAGGPAHPCFFYESVLCLIGFIVLHIFNRKFRRYDGQTFLLYIVWYGLCRFFIEGLRTDSLMLPFGDLRVSQALAAVCVVFGVILLIACRHKTSLTGCGSRKVMEAVGLLAPKVAPGTEKSTIFTEFSDIEDEDDVVSPEAEEETEVEPAPAAEETETADEAAVEESTAEEAENLEETTEVEK